MQTVAILNSMRPQLKCAGNLRDVSLVELAGAEDVKEVARKHDAGRFREMRVANTVEIGEAGLVLQVIGKRSRDVEVEQPSGVGEPQAAGGLSVDAFSQSAHLRSAMHGPKMSDDGAFRSEFKFLGIKVVHITHADGNPPLPFGGTDPVLGPFRSACENTFFRRGPQHVIAVPRRF